ncbi:glycerate kinase [Mycobacterium deserti]|uniref:Glycerate kinase n=1 Tax=Mycobacterium deserti TaxID=2978347 RepID=A0ABT2MAN3_9MYCO|nr:glycerate kinase [Mycobacterium deserti]MCT7659328.1 glycerate kinase [Mycobacterium deserti]
MKIVLAPDSFKESMSATQAVAAMRDGVLSVMPDAECVGVPMADGGEGTVDAVVEALHGQHVDVEVSDPRGRPVAAQYGYVPLRQLAVIEMAAAAGLELVAPGQRDVLRSSTFGVGQLILSALNRGAEEILIGIGGSATNDGGTGMLTALGAVFTDAGGKVLPPGGAALQRLDRIDVSGLDPRLREVRIHVASDVTAPLLGPTGASAVFGPQKGATAADVDLLEAALSRLAAVASTTLGGVNPDHPGAGAAGGLGFALVEFLGAQSKPGVEEVAQTVGLERALRDADWVFTGEGSVDAQTVMGKTPFGVAQLAVRHGTRVIIFAGRVGPDASVLLDHGVERLVAITAEGTPLEQALRDGAESLTRATAEVCRDLVS